MKYHIDFSSRHAVNISTKFSNTTTFLTHTAKWIIRDIFLTEPTSPQHFTSSMVTSLTGVSRNNPRHKYSVSMQKQ